MKLIPYNISSKTKLIAMLIAATILNAIDLFQTLYKGFSSTRYIEVNTFICWLYQRNPALPLLCKLVITILFMFIAIILSKKNFAFVYFNTLILLIGYCLIVAWNFGVMIAK